MQQYFCKHFSDFILNVGISDGNLIGFSTVSRTVKPHIVLSFLW